jgi:hypothetical protein
MSRIHERAAALPWGGEIMRPVRIVSAAHATIMRWSSELLGRDIHVSRMSRHWLRTHQSDQGKRGADI